MTVEHWKYGRSYALPRKQTVDAPFRISFVVDGRGDVIPLQQCTDVKFEEQHVVNASAWFRDPRSLVGFWEPTPVSKQLDRVVSSLLGGALVGLRGTDGLD